MAYVDDTDTEWNAVAAWLTVCHSIFEFADCGCAYFLWCIFAASRFFFLGDILVCRVCTELCIFPVTDLLRI